MQTQAGYSWGRFSCRSSQKTCLVYGPCCQCHHVTLLLVGSCSLAGFSLHGQLCMGMHGMKNRATFGSSTLMPLHVRGKGMPCQAAQHVCKWHRRLPCHEAPLWLCNWCSLQQRAFFASFCRQCSKGNISALAVVQTYSTQE